MRPSKRSVQVHLGQICADDEGVGERKSTYKKGFWRDKTVELSGGLFAPLEEAQSIENRRVNLFLHGKWQKCQYEGLDDLSGGSYDELEWVAKMLGTAHLPLGQSSLRCYPVAEIRAEVDKKLDGTSVFGNLVHEQDLLCTFCGCRMIAGTELYVPDASGHWAYIACFACAHKGE